MLFFRYLGVAFVICVGVLLWYHLYYFFFELLDFQIWVYRLRLEVGDQLWSVKDWVDSAANYFWDLLWIESWFEDGWWDWDVPAEKLSAFTTKISLFSMFLSWILSLYAIKLLFSLLFWCVDFVERLKKFLQL